MTAKKPFKVGDHVRWNSEAGHVGGTITKIHEHDFDWHGYTHHCSPDEPNTRSGATGPTTSPCTRAPRCGTRSAIPS